MKTFFLVFLGMTYLLLAKLVEAAIFSNVYFFIGLGVLIAGIIRYVKERYIYNNRLNEMKEASEEELMAIPHTHCIMSNDCLNALLLNEPTNTLFLVSREDLEDDLIKKEISFNKIYEVAIVEDEMYIARTSNSLISGSLLGEDLDIEEEESDDEDPEDNTVSQLTLKIVADNLSNPILEYVFLDNGEPISREEDEYQEALELCEEWFQKISVIIKRYELERVPIRQWQ
ncbi:ceramidase [Lysinibacillus sp. CTST325]